VRSLSVLSHAIFFCLAVFLGCGSSYAAAQNCAVYQHPQQTTHVAGWTIEQQAPDVGNAPNIVAHVASSPDRAKQHFSCLMIQCTGGEIAAYLESTVTTSVAGRKVRVVYKIDNGPWLARQFSASNDGLALGLWQSAKALQFIDDISGGKLLSVSVKPSSGATSATTFNIDGIDQAIGPARSACRR
jgi:hypothetical protein